MSVDDFFKENVVQNLAAILGIKPDNIRVMQVVSTGATRKRRNVEGSSEMTVSRAFWKMLEFYLVPYQTSVMKCFCKTSDF